MVPLLILCLDDKEVTKVKVQYHLTLHQGEWHPWLYNHFSSVFFFSFPTEKVIESWEGSGYLHLVHIPLFVTGEAKEAFAEVC